MDVVAFNSRVKALLEEQCPEIPLAFKQKNTPANDCELLSTQHFFVGLYCSKGQVKLRVWEKIHYFEFGEWLRHAAQCLPQSQGALASWKDSQSHTGRFLLDLVRPADWSESSSELMACMTAADFKAIYDWLEKLGALDYPPRRTRKSSLKEECPDNFGWSPYAVEILGRKTFVDGWRDLFDKVCTVLKAKSDRDFLVGVDRIVQLGVGENGPYSPNLRVVSFNCNDVASARCLNPPRLDCGLYVNVSDCSVACRLKALRVLCHACDVEISDVGISYRQR